MHIFLVNGPPRSGKDTVGSIISDLFGARRVDKFARILKERTHALYGLFDETGCVQPHYEYEEQKDTPLPEFLGLTPRQAYIHVSETYMKPVHGDVIFATLLADEWESEFDFGGMPEGNFVITDSGFVGEATELLRRFPHADVTLFRLHREGCDFGNDSRGHITLIDPNATLEPREVRTIDIVNNDTLADLREVVARAVSSSLRVELPGRYVAEVQVPGADECGGNPQWIEFKSGNDRDLMLASIESARRSHYQQRVVRLIDRFAVDGIDLGERYIYPGDAPVYDLEVSRA